MKKRKTKKRRRMIKPKIQTAFCLISLAFIIGCCIYYGNRLIKYYKIYNPKSETGETLMTLASTITSKSQIVYEGDGLYLDNGNYIYKERDYLLPSEEWIKDNSELAGEKECF